MKKAFFDRRLDVQHTNAGQNIQHPLARALKYECRFFGTFCILEYLLTTMSRILLSNLIFNTKYLKYLYQRINHCEH